MKKILSLFVFSFASLTSFAQSNDFGMDFTVEADKKLRPGTHVFVEGGARTMDNTRKIDRWTVGLGVSQRLYTDGVFELKAALKWEYMWVNYPEQTKDKTENYELEHTGIDTDGNAYTYYTDDYLGYNHRHQFWRGRHRTSLSLQGEYKPNKRWTFSLKEMVQYSHFNRATTTMDRYRIEEEEEDEDGNITYTYYLDEDNQKHYKAKDKVVLRSKVGIDYDIRHCPVNPYVSAEYGCGLNYTTNKWKFVAGVGIKLNKQNKIDFFYRYQTEDDDDEPNGHIIGLGYSLKF